VVFHDAITAYEQDMSGDSSDVARIESEDNDPVVSEPMRDHIHWSHLAT
jgi:hypothetical protein